MTISLHELKPTLRYMRGDVYQDMKLVYDVPSEVRKDRRYEVTVHTRTGRLVKATCTCPDHTYREHACKHIRACHARLYGKEMPDAYA